MNSKRFEVLIDGKKTQLFTLKNNNGLSAIFSNYGQRIIALNVPDKKGNFDDIVLGFSSLKEYFTGPGKYFGAFIGRYGNRIASGKYQHAGVTYQLTQNEGENHLHGGEKGFESIIWEANQINEKEIQFEGISLDGAEGYPGNLSLKVHYTLNDNDELAISYQATCDKPTPVNLTHHSYFNLSGAGNGTIDQHILQINASKYTPVDESLIPTGVLESVKDTPFDFTQPKSIGKDIENVHKQLDLGSGYDHNFVLDNMSQKQDGLFCAAKVTEPNSGRFMEVFTNEPGMQFYSGNFLDVKGKDGKMYPNRGAFCLETQHFPNSPNVPQFPNTLINPGEVYSSKCTYRFRTLSS